MKYHFTPEQVDLIVTCLEYARCDMNKTNTIDSAIANTCKRYCVKRVTEILKKLQPRPFVPEPLPIVPPPDSFKLLPEEEETHA